MAPKESVEAKKSGDEPEPCVGDWKCAQCKHWNKFYHEKCRTHDDDSGRDCDGSRSFPGDVECVQENDGKAKRNNMGRYKGDWYCGLCDAWNFKNSYKRRSCTTSSGDTEHVMSVDDGLREVPPLPPSPEHETYQEKMDVYFRVNGRFVTPRKRPY